MFRCLRQLFCALALLLTLPQAGHATPAELAKPALTLAVGGKPLFYYLPLTIAEQRGYFKEQGLRVNIVDFPGGAKSLQAVMGGSADLAAGSFEHVVNMQARGQALKAITLLARYPAIVLAVRQDLVGTYRGPADLRGWKIGVTAPGSSTHLFLNNVLHRAGVNPTEVSVIGVGTGGGALAAMQRGELDAIAHLDPIIGRLVHANVARVVIDTRTEQGAREVYGGAYHAACLYAKAAFIAEHPRTIQAVVNAQVKALRWLGTASLDEIIANVPEAYWAGQRDEYREALKNNLPALSPDGAMDLDGARNVLKVLAAFEPFVRDAKLNVTDALDTTFVTNASP